MSKAVSRCFKKGTHYPLHETKDTKYRTLSLSIATVALVAFSLNLTMLLEGQGGENLRCSPLTPERHFRSNSRAVRNPIRSPFKGLKNRPRFIADLKWKWEPKMVPKSITVISGGCLGGGLDRCVEKDHKANLFKPSQEGSRLDESTVFTFPSGRKKYPNLWPKALKMEARCSQNALQRASQKSVRNKCHFQSLWGYPKMSKGR